MKVWGFDIGCSNAPCWLLPLLALTWPLQRCPSFNLGWRLMQFEAHSRVLPSVEQEGVCRVEEWTWLLYENSARGSRECQSFCHSLMKSRRYCPSSWLTHSVCLS